MSASGSDFKNKAQKYHKSPRGIATAKEYRARPEVRTKSAAATAQWRKLNPEKHQAYLDRTKAKRREQGTRANWRRKGYPEPTRPRPDRCECCGCSPASRYKLHLDHDHAIGVFRGWLCHNCNTGLGKLGDTIEGLERMIRYLQRASHFVMAGVLTPEHHMIG